MIRELFEPLVLLAVHAGIVVAVVGATKRWAGMDYEKGLAAVGGIAVVIFAMCVGVPYFLQGYADTASLSEGVPLGLTKNAAIGAFAYFYTFKWNGFAWLSTALACIALGRFSATVIVDCAVKWALVVTACLMLTRVDEFAETINVVLE